MEVALRQGLGRYRAGEASGLITNAARVGAAVEGSKCRWLAVHVLEDIEFSHRWPVPGNMVSETFYIGEKSIMTWCLLVIATEVCS